MISQRWKTKIIILQWTTLRYWVVANSEHNHTMFLFSWRLWLQKLFFKPNKHTLFTCIALLWNQNIALVYPYSSLFCCHVLTKWHFSCFHPLKLSCHKPRSQNSVVWPLRLTFTSFFNPHVTSRMFAKKGDYMLPLAEVEKSKCKCVCDVQC